jgi:hypothetical protein
VDAEQLVRQNWPLLKATMAERTRAAGCSRGCAAKELRELLIERYEFHGDWNYVIKPRT